MTWLADLEAERVTHSRETHEQLMARLEGERPEAPEQLALRRRMEYAAALREAEVSFDAGSGTHLERLMAKARLAAVVEEIAAAHTQWIGAA